MKQTISINLAGLVFHIEKEAFDELQHYLDEIKNNLSANESREEILQDIESRIAEIFQENLSSRKEAVTMEDVNAVKSALGEAQTFSNDAPKEDADSEKEGQQKQHFTRKGHIHRDIDNKVFGGVCSGIAQYYHFNPLWLRLAFILAVLLSGTGILIYLILWVIMPAAKTPSQKMEMRGERVTVSNIEKSYDNSSSGGNYSSTYQHETKSDFTASGKDFLKTILEWMETGFQRLGSACKKATSQLESNQ